MILRIGDTVTIEDYSHITTGKVIRGFDDDHHTVRGHGEEVSLDDFFLVECEDGEKVQFAAWLLDLTTDITIH